MTYKKVNAAFSTQVSEHKLNTSGAILFFVTASCLLALAWWKYTGTERSLGRSSPQDQERTLSGYIALFVGFLMGCLTSDWKQKWTATLHKVTVGFNFWVLRWKLRVSLLMERMAETWRSMRG